MILNKVHLKNAENKSKKYNIELSIIIVFSKYVKLLNLINSIMIQNFLYFDIIIIDNGVDEKDYLLII